MLNESAIKELEKQQYRIVGSHSAVKVCGWTRNMIRGQGGCYKLKFYGIMSHQCMQMTTSMSCANRCTFCWRGYKAPVSKTWDWKVDDSQYIFENSLIAHHKLLIGFKGSDKKIDKLYEQSQDVKHVALSLTGEPIIYPKINELITKFHEDGVSTFLVTNSQYPKEIEELEEITQLYLSIDAPNKEILKEVDKPLFSDFYERMLASLDALARKKLRTAIRITQIKNVNDVEAQNYAKLILRGKSDFIEVKGYMHVGASQERLGRKNMPIHEEVVDFSKKIVEYLPGYDIVSEHIPSRVVLLAKKEWKIDGEWKTWIDFKKFDKLVNSGEDFDRWDYYVKTPQVGLSGKGTIDGMSDSSKKRYLSENPECLVFVDEKTSEVDLYNDE
jgi:tRNA wybutosine-synthesizing protein 1